MADRDEGKVEKSKKISRQIAGTSKEKRADEKYNRIMEQFGSIEAYEQARQEFKSHKKPKGSGIAQRGLGKAFNKGGKV